MGIVVSSSRAVSAAPSSSEGGLLMVLPCSSVGSLLQEIILHGLLLPLGCSSALIAPAWVSSMECSPSGKGCSNLGVPQGHKSWQQTCFREGSSFHGARGPARSLLQCELPMWWSFPPLGTTCSSMGSSTSCRCSPWSSQQDAGESLLYCLEHLLALFTLLWDLPAQNKLQR